MSVTYDNASGNKEGADSSPLTWSHTIGSGSNRLLVVGVTNNFNTGTVSVKYNTVAMTEWSHYHGNNDTGNPFITFFYMKEASLPSSGSYTVEVTYGGGTTVVTAGAISFAGVDQTTPLQNKDEGSNNTGLSTSVTSSTDNMVVLFAGAGTVPGTLGGGGSPTERVRQEYDGGSDCMNNIVGVTAAGAASVGITYTDISDWYTWIGADVKAGSSFSTCWGHDTGVQEESVRNLTTWSGTGFVAGSGDSERLVISSGEYMESENIYTGEKNITLAKNKYATAGDG